MHINAIAIAIEPEKPEQCKSTLQIPMSTSYTDTYSYILVEILKNLLVYETELSFNGFYMHKIFSLFEFLLHTIPLSFLLSLPLFSILLTSLKPSRL
jgi:hypothetical protein